MFRNHLKIAVRNLWNKRAYTGINLLGLSVASAFCLLVYFYVQQERSFDQFHARGDRLYRVEATSLFDFGKSEKKKKSFFSFLTGDQQAERKMLTQTFVLGDDLKKSLPEVEASVRLSTQRNAIVRVHDESYKLENEGAAYVEKNFFDVLDFPLLKGNPAVVLQGPNNVVLSERMAKRFFGNTEAVGKTLEIPSVSTAIFTVTGIAKDFPANSSLRYDLVIPLEADPSYAERMADHSNNHFSHPTLILLRKNTNVTAFRAKLDRFSKDYFSATVKEWQEQDPDHKVTDFRLYIRPFAEAHYNMSYPWGHYTNLDNLYQLIALSVIILLIACVNYVLLTLTNTISRSQEVGIRKSMGASRRHIIWQFLTETQLLVLLSFVCGLLISMTCMPLFNRLTGADLNIALFSFKEYLIAAGMLFLLLGFLAGFYPALVMSGMRPLNMLRKFSSVKLNPVLSKGLVVIQYSACLLLLISSLVISRQMKFMNTMQLGFDKEQVLMIENPYDYQDPDRVRLKDRVYQFAASDPEIAKATSTNYKFGYGFNMNGHLINGQREMIFQVPVDFNYFDFMSIPLSKGRFFSKDMPTDSAAIEIPEKLKVEGSSSVRKAIVVNETLYDMLGRPKLDEINPAMGAKIIGVCKNYHFWNATQKIPPAYHMIGGKYGYNYIWLKIKPGQPLPAAIDRIRTAWNEITFKQPFTYSFQDEEVKKSFEAYTTWLNTINVATLLAVLIACMGLFGLSALYAVNRTKEIGIRKVMGASVANIFMLLNKDVIKLALVSLVIAVPLGIYFMKDWLQNFAQRIDLTWMIFLLAGGIGLFLAIVAVGYHSLKAAVANPVEALRSE